jgi:hypothetical protein
MLSCASLKGVVALSHVPQLSVSCPQFESIILILGGGGQWPTSAPESRLHPTPNSFDFDEAATHRHAAANQHAAVMAVQPVTDIAGESNHVIFATIPSRVDAKRLTCLQLGQTTCELAPLGLSYRLAFHALACILSPKTACVPSDGYLCEARDSIQN